MAKKRNTALNRDANPNSNLVIVTFYVPKYMLEEMDQLVKQGRFANRSELIRFAIQELIMKERLNKQMKAGLIALGR